MAQSYFWVAVWGFTFFSIYLTFRNTMIAMIFGFFVLALNSQFDMLPTAFLELLYLLFGVALTILLFRFIVSKLRG